MSGHPPRTYDGSGRRAAAQRNHEHIAACARRFFVADGYAATTVGAVAAAAGVAPQTIYAAFGSKKGLLEHLVLSVVNDPVPVAEQEWVVTAGTAPTLDERVLALVDGSSRLLERSADVFLVLDEARGADPALTELWQEGGRRRRRVMSGIVRGMVADGLVDGSVPQEAVVDALWAMTSPELFHLFVTGRSWTTRRYRTWLARHVAAELQAPEPAPGG